MMKYFLCLFLCQITLVSLAVDIRPVNLRTEYKNNPFLDDIAPRLSWELTSDKQNQYQSAYQILVASSPDKLKKNEGDLWNTGKVVSGQTNQLEYVGATLRSRQKAWWKVKVWNADGHEGRWSEPNFWEMGLLNTDDWKAKWVGADLNHLAKAGKYHLPPSPYIRKGTQIKKKVKSARLYIASLGIHEFFINGERVGQDYFGSGWTDYNKRVYYQVYDVTSSIKRGDNAFAAVLSNGWYAGYLGYALLVGSKQVRAFYGDFPLLKAQVEISYNDGTHETISTDADWRGTTGAIQESDFLQGEFYDATKEKKDWHKASFDDSSWEKVQIVQDIPSQQMQLYPGNPVRVVGELSPKSVKKIGPEKYMVDFGQNFAGIIRLKAKGERNDTLVFRYGEMLHPDGSLVTENLRAARATDTYVFNGNPKGEEWAPSFTFHGFQFVEVNGLKEMPDKDFLTGLVLSSDLQTTGYFHSDNDLLNQIYSNIVWTQRANYLDIPTDCPQRDERLGWTGDAQVYMRSAAYNTDIAAFHTKWIQDLNDAQWPNGAFPIYAPMPIGSDGKAAIRPSDTYSPGWSEAGIICTYEIYRAYGDTKIIRQSLPYMERFMDFLKTKADKNGLLAEGSFEEISPKGGFGDWLSIGKKTSPDLLATLYYYYCSKLMHEMCAAIGETQRTAHYNQTILSIKQAFKKHYTNGLGKFKVNEAFYGNGDGYVEGGNGFSGHTQTAYANAIYMDALDKKDLLQAGKYLRELVEQNGDKLTTGFLGFKPLLPALSATGSSDKAYKLILSTEYPSLGYEVMNGATSIWERWDSYTKDQGFVHNAAMNSFSHYAFGAVNEWIFENMLGIRPLEAGFRSFDIKPEIPEDMYALKKVKGSYHSIMGLIRSEWDYSGKDKVHALDIPVNTTAYFYLETPSLSNVYVNNKPIAQSSLIQVLEKEDGFFQIKLGSGNYQIVVINE